MAANVQTNSEIIVIKDELNKIILLIQYILRYKRIMKIHNQLTDKAILEELGNRISSCRIRVGLTQGEASSKSGIAKRTLERVEAGLPAQSDNLVKIFRVLGILDRLDALIPEDTGPSPMELLKLKGKEKQRASKPHKVNKATAKDWSWGDNK